MKRGKITKNFAIKDVTVGFGPVFRKLSVFSSDIKTDIIFGIYGIENPRKHY